MNDAVRALVPAIGGALAPNATEAELRRWLQSEVSRLLHTDRARLMALLYRIDVRERDLAHAFAAADVPAALSETLIDRMAEKLRYRQASAAPPMPPAAPANP